MDYGKASCSHYITEQQEAVCETIKGNAEGSEDKKCCANIKYT